MPIPIHSPPPPSPDGLTPTRKLLKEIVDAGGILELDISDDKTSYRSLVGIINHRGMAPDGQQVILIEGAKYGNTPAVLLFWLTQRKRVSCPSGTTRRGGSTPSP